MIEEVDNYQVSSNMRTRIIRKKINGKFQQRKGYAKYFAYIQIRHLDIFVFLDFNKVISDNIEEGFYKSDLRFTSKSIVEIEDMIRKFANENNKEFIQYTNKSIKLNGKGN